MQGRRWIRTSIFAVIMILLLAIEVPAAVGPGTLLNRYQPRSPALPEQWAAAYGYSSGEMLRFFMEPGWGVPVFQGEVNERQLSLFFDTGDSFGLTVPVNLLRQKGWAVTGAVPQVVGGEALGSFPTFAVSSFSVGGWSLPVQEGVSNNKTRMPHFGYGPLAGKRFTLDYDHGWAAISERPLPESITPERTRYITRFRSPGNQRGIVLIPVRFKGKEYLAMVDTGASVSVIDSRLAEECGLKPNLFGRVKIEALEFGPFRVDIPSAARRPVWGLFREGPRPDFVIGADLLCRFLVTFDYAGGRFILER